MDSKPLDTNDREMADAAMYGVYGTHFKRFKLIYRPGGKFGSRPQDDYEFLTLILKVDTEAELEQFRESMHRFDVRVEYESLYEEPEIYDSRLKERPA